MLFILCVIRREHLVATKPSAALNWWKLLMKLEIDPWTSDYSKHCMKVWIHRMNIFEDKMAVQSTSSVKSCQGTSKTVFKKATLH